MCVCFCFVDGIESVVLFDLCIVLCFLMIGLIWEVLVFWCVVLL